jgi:hypothetical protein
VNDRELLELAAKAAGIEYSYWSETGLVRLDEKGDWQPGCQWNPLNDDGDAFRLALKLRIQIEYVDEIDSVMCSLPGSMGATSVAAIGDVELRYAIVQAAAQLGATL